LGSAKFAGAADHQGSVGHYSYKCCIFFNILASVKSPPSDGRAFDYLLHFHIHSGISGTIFDNKLVFNDMPQLKHIAANLLLAAPALCLAFS